MKKIVRQQNYLKELINSQANRILSKSALRCVVRAVLEPLLDKPEEGVVLYRVINGEGLLGLLKRLEFSDIESYDFSDDSGNLREKVWAGTEFICVMTQRYVSIVLWDDKTENKDTVRYYSVFNSKLQNEALDIINRNTIIDIKKFQERFRPDRRDNNLLNTAIRKIAENLDEASKDAVLGFAEIQTEKDEYGNIRAVAHEIKNQLSICDLYSEIIRKYCIKNSINDETIFNAVSCITRAVKLANNSLVELKSSRGTDLKPHNLREIIQNAVDLTKVYTECKNIEYIVENNIDDNILIDEDKFTSVLINLVKNASEAFDAENDQNGKYIKITTAKEGELALISISNNAGEIAEPEKIFEEGYTTKSGGSGVGLSICKKSTEEQFGKLILQHTGQDYTEFVIKIGLL